jgi:hypothetical protein
MLPKISVENKTKMSIAGGETEQDRVSGNITKLDVAISSGLNSNFSFCKRKMKFKPLNRSTQI